MNLNKDNKKFVQVSQSWTAKTGVKVGDKWDYINPVTDEGKNRLTSLADLQKLIDFFQWSEGVHFKFQDTSVASWGSEVYQINHDQSLALVNSNYDSSD